MPPPASGEQTNRGWTGARGLVAPQVLPFAGTGMMKRHLLLAVIQSVIESPCRLDKRFAEFCRKLDRNQSLHLIDERHQLIPRSIDLAVLDLECRTTPTNRVLIPLHTEST